MVGKIKSLITSNMITTTLAFLVAGTNAVGQLPQYAEHQNMIMFVGSIIGSFALLVAKDPNK